MKASNNRAELIQLSRSVPRDVIGFASVGGFLLAIVGLAGLIGAVIVALGGGQPLIDWRIAAVCVVGGAVLTSGAGFVIGRRFVIRATAAGYTAEQIRELEDEAERLDEEEA